jgi:hypothetical protein
VPSQGLSSLAASSLLCLMVVDEGTGRRGSIRTNEMVPVFSHPESASMVRQIYRP